MNEGPAIEEIDRPTIERSDGVLVEVVDAGWCQTDDHVIEGMRAEYVDRDLPRLGHENAGRVVETGVKVDVVPEAVDPNPVSRERAGVCPIAET